MMEESCVSDAIKQIRTTNREDLSALRKQDREALLRQRRLTFCEAEALVSTITLKQFKELSLKVKEKKTTVEVLKAIKNNCCSSDRTEAFMKIENALNSLMRFLVGRDAQMQLEAAACITNLARGSHKTAQRIAKAAGPYLVSFLGSGSFYLRDQSAWACGNIANCCFQCFSLLKAQGLVPGLLANIESSVPDVITSIVFALNASTKYEDDDLRELSNHHTINCLLTVLDQGNLPQSALSDASFVLSNIFFLVAKNNIDINDSTIEKIITHLENSVSRKDRDILLAVPLVRCLGFVSHRPPTCQFLSRHPKFNRSVVQILSSGCPCLVTEMLWTLTNIAGCCEISTEDVDLSVIFQSIDLKNSKDPSIIQVLYFLCTWASRSENVRILLREQEFSSKIEALLTSEEKSIVNGAQVLLATLR